MTPTDPDVAERLVDQLQIALPLVQRLKVMAKQHAEDAGHALDALERAVGLLASFARLERDRQRARREKGGA